MALRELMGLIDQGPDDRIYRVIAEFTSDHDPTIARIAMRFLLGQSWGELDRLLPQLINTPHDEVRQLASQRIAPRVFSRMWHSWSSLSNERRLTLGRAMVKIDPRFLHHIAAKLASNDRSTVLRAISMVRHLNQGAYFESALVWLAGRRDEVIASAAVSAMSAATTREAVEAIERCLDHPNSRVRANAIEALMGQPTGPIDHEPQLLTKARDEDNRPRANAIAALLRSRREPAVHWLKHMLTDGRPLQRISGLWVVQSGRLIETAGVVAELSVSDRDTAVRERAERTIQGLIQIMHATPQSARATQPLPTSSQAIDQPHAREAVLS